MEKNTIKFLQIKNNSMSAAKPKALFYPRNVLLKARNYFPNLDVMLPKYNKYKKIRYEGNQELL